MDARTKSTARRRVERLFPNSAPGLACRWLHALDELPPSRAVILARVSSWTQAFNDNLAPQLDFIRQRCLARGFEAIAIYSEVGAGWRSGRELDRGRLRAAIEVARERGAIVVAESTDRFIRSVDYDPQTCPWAWPTEFDFGLLAELAKGVTLATALHPNTPWREVRGHQSRRGQAGKDQKGGRPRITRAGDLKRRRQRWFDAVRELDQMGWCLDDLEGFTNVPRSTLHRWIRED